MRLAVLVLALAPLATTRAEVVHLLEDFSDAQRFFTDAGASLGPGFWDSGAMNASTTEEGALRVDYETYDLRRLAGRDAASWCCVGRDQIASKRGD